MKKHFNIKFASGKSNPRGEYWISVCDGDNYWNYNKIYKRYSDSTLQRVLKIIEGYKNK